MKENVPDVNEIKKDMSKLDVFMDYSKLHCIFYVFKILCFCSIFIMQKELAFKRAT